ncbi:MAG: aspartate--tRNA(Asn) ligase [Candidatus Cardinium sp.]|nr:aspartate--tRNA(Asn) ligase [Candidatus Cardinium sp.]
MHALIEIKNLASLSEQQIVRVRGRVFSKKVHGNLLFLILRDGLHTLQVIAVKGKAVAGHTLSDRCYEELRKVENESFIEAIGIVQRTEKPVLACSQQEIELRLIAYTLISRAILTLPITLKETERAEVAAAIPYGKRLDNRVLDLRTRLSQAIFRVNDGMLGYIQKYLREEEFMEIKTPKLIGGSSEGGAAPFRLDYFGQPACLAQSPQLYKQMALMGGFKRVFEIGPVFRAEHSHTTRHLTEFVGIDLEMLLDETYQEVIQLLYRLLTALFTKLNEQYSSEIAFIQAFFHTTPLLFAPELVALTFPEAVALLSTSGSTRGEEEDFSTEEEKQLGAIIRKQYQTDLYVVTGYPAAVRPFYTFIDPENPTYTYGYDFMLRGMEILSGAQRIHDYKLLSERAAALGIAAHTMSHYLEAFQYGAPPHAGAGMGLERLLRAFLGLPDVRYSSLFPRYPKRLYP